MIKDDGAGDRDGNDSDSVDFLDFSPRFGVVWRAAKTVQVYGNASRTYEPPLLLELTAPGQLQGNLGQLAAQKAWQFEVGTRGSYTDRFNWDLAVYDIELHDEIVNLNVQPFPGAPFTIPRFVNINRSRHSGVEAGADVVLVRDAARAMGMGTIGDALSARVAYTYSRFVFVDDPTFHNNDLPGAPTHFIRAEVRYDHQSGFWIAPKQALQDAEGGSRTLVLPTMMNLTKLARYATVAEAVAATRAQPIVTVTPRVERTTDGRKLHIPAEAGYGVTEVFVPMPKR